MSSVFWLLIRLLSPDPLMMLLWCRHDAIILLNFYSLVMYILVLIRRKPVLKLISRRFGNQSRNPHFCNIPVISVLRIHVLWNYFQITKIKLFEHLSQRLRVFPWITFTRKFKTSFLEFVSSVFRSLGLSSQSTRTKFSKFQDSQASLKYNYFHSWTHSSEP
jgi:hypothetical protein